MAFNAKQLLPVIYSPKFWGIVLTALAAWFHNHGFVFTADALADFLLTVAGGATGVGVLDSLARKMK